VVLYQMVNGRTPFTAGSTLELLRRIADEEPPRTAATRSRTSARIDPALSAKEPARPLRRRGRIRRRPGALAARRTHFRPRALLIRASLAMGRRRPAGRGFIRAVALSLLGVAV